MEGNINCYPPGSSPQNCHSRQNCNQGASLLYVIHNDDFSKKDKDDDDLRLMGYQGFHKDWLYGQFLGRTKGVYALCPLHLQINIVHLHIILQTNNIAWGGRMQNENVPHV